MKQLYSLLVVLMVLILASGCVEKTGYYSDGEEDTISLICDNTWASEKQLMMKKSPIMAYITLRKTVRTLES